MAKWDMAPITRKRNAIFLFSKNKEITPAIKKDVIGIWKTGRKSVKSIPI
jgi:hypothetical protein